MSTKTGADPIVFALLQWPAIIGVLEIPHTLWGWPLIVLLSLWILALQSSAFRGKYTIRPDFGFLIFCLNGAFVGAWLAYPHSGVWVWASFCLFLFLAGVGVAKKLNLPR